MGTTRKDVTQKFLLRQYLQVLNFKKSAKSGPDCPPQAKGIKYIALDRVVRLG